MRIAYLCKRHYMGHDVIQDQYARLYEQPSQLARRGHDVLGLCTSYRACDERDEEHESSAGSLRWIGLSPGPARHRLPRYPIELLKHLQRFRPDILVGSSDAPHIVVGSWLSERLSVPYAADLYDHFESFGLSRLPGLVSRLRRAVANAAVVTTVSGPLAGLVREQYRARGEVVALPSTIDRAVFFPTDKASARDRLGLPQDVGLVGTAGGLLREKGIQVVYSAFARLASRVENVCLVLAGPTDRRLPPPDDQRVIYLGERSHADVATLFSALDVGIVHLRDTAYGKYSFPQKTYEMAACEIPMAVARVGSMADLFGDTPDVLYTPDDAGSLAAVLEAQLQEPVAPRLEIRDWEDMAGSLESLYQAAIAHG